MSKSKGRITPPPKQLSGDFQRIIRWNYCQKIGQLIYHGRRLDLEIETMYAEELKRFNKDTQWKTKN